VLVVGFEGYSLSFFTIASYFSLYIQLIRDFFFCFYHQLNLVWGSVRDFLNVHNFYVNLICTLLPIEGSECDFVPYFCLKEIPWVTHTSTSYIDERVN
jgi:hypothetical protein